MQNIILAIDCKTSVPFKKTADAVEGISKCGRICKVISDVFVYTWNFNIDLAHDVEEALS